MPALSSVLRFCVRWIGRAVLAVVALLVLAVLAWLPFNIGQSPPSPRSREFELPAARVPDERNAAFAFEGLLAEAGRDPAAAGRASWAAMRAWGALPPARRASEAAARDAKSSEALGKLLSAPKGALLTCQGKARNCEAAWLADPDALAREQAEFGAIGQRCDRILDGPFEFEELHPAGRGADAPIMRWLAMTQCSRWFRSGAMLALARGKHDEALARLERADRLHRTLWDGSRTLVGYMVSTRLARDTYGTMAAAALREPALAAAMAPWLASPLDTRVAVRRWLPMEVAFAHGVIDEVVASLRAGQAAIYDPFAGMLEARGAIVDWLIGHGIGFDVERTKQRLDAHWQPVLARMQQPWPAILSPAEGRAPASAPAAETGAPSWSWRNTFGEMIAGLVDAQPAVYLARHADHELHRAATALVLALQRERVAAPQRAEAARKVAGADNALGQRMSWSQDGKTLTVRPWQADTPGVRVDMSREAIVFAWPQ